MNKKLFANLIENAEKEVKLYLKGDPENWDDKITAISMLVYFIDHEFDSNIIYLVDLEYNAGNLEESISFYWDTQYIDEDESINEEIKRENADIIKEALDGVKNDAARCLKNIRYLKANLDWFCQPGVNHYLHTTEW